MIVRGALAFLLLLLFARTTTALAQGLQSCGGAATTAGMQACEGQRYNAATADLIAVYARVLRQSSPTARGKLVMSQAAWMRFRDADATFQAASAGDGTMAPLLRLTTLTTLTVARTAELKQQLR